MTTAWLLNTVGLFATTIGALLMCLHLQRAAPLFENPATPEANQVYRKHRRLLQVGVGLLTAWLVLQSLAVILL
jgi:hypothetical protein